MPRRKKTQVTEFQSFVFEIVTWEPEYHFALNSSKWPPGPYWEHCELTCQCTLLIPSKLTGRHVMVRVLGDRGEMTAVQRPAEVTSPPVAIGGLTLRGQQSDYLGSIPFDAFWGVTAMLAANRVRYITLHGEVLSGGRTRIRSIGFQPNFNAEDYE